MQVTTKTILLVEDDMSLGQLYERELRDEGYHVLRARNGREGVEMAHETQPDLVLLDINMPGMDGLEAMGRMIEEQPKLPVIINTAYAHYQDNFQSWLADAYLVKSSDVSELKNCIKEALRIAAENQDATR